MFYRLRLRLRLQNTDESLCLDSLTHPETNSGGGQLAGNEVPQTFPLVCHQICYTEIPLFGFGQQPLRAWIVPRFNKAPPPSCLMCVVFCRILVFSVWHFNDVFRQSLFNDRGLQDKQVIYMENFFQYPRRASSLSEPGISGSIRDCNKYCNDWTPETFPVKALWSTQVIKVFNANVFSTKHRCLVV